MFTGIITDTLAITRSENSEEGLVLVFAKPMQWTDLSVGESIATNGVCLTVIEIRDSEYDCLVMPETLNKSAFGSQVPEFVNVERAMLLTDRLSGHIVQGHVDCVGTVVKIQKQTDWRVTIKFDKKQRPLIIPKGSITINGVSLTIADVTDDTLTVALIPYTLQHTTLHSLLEGDLLNLEFDMIGKYVVNFLNGR